MQRSEQNPSSPSMWDGRYAGEAYHYGTEPNAFLKLQEPRFAKGQCALCVAEGEGRNAVWLAQQGLTVTAVDLSTVGLEKTKRLARERGVSIQTIQADLLTWDWPRQAFDVVVATFLHLPREPLSKIHAAMLEATKPGGLVIVEAFHPDHLGQGRGGPQRPELLIDVDRLRQDFASATIIQLEAVRTELSEGEGHRGPAVVTRAIFQSPSRAKEI